MKLRDTIKHASGETIDLKAYEADMRHLIDTYVEAKESRQISAFGELGLLDLILKLGIAEAIDTLPAGIKTDKRAVAETIANNVRSKILKSHLLDPAFYDRMSALLAEIVADLRDLRITYEVYLQRIAVLVCSVQSGMTDDTSQKLNTAGKRALYSNLKTSGQKRSDQELLDLALRLDASIKKHRPNAWRGVKAKEQIVKQAMFRELLDEPEVERLFRIVFNQTEY